MVLNNVVNVLPFSQIGRETVQPTLYIYSELEVIQLWWLYGQFMGTPIPSKK